MHLRRDEAIKLRKEGKTYNEINEITGIGKGALSYMLRSVNLSEEQIKNLEKRKKKRKRSRIVGLVKSNREKQESSIFKRNKTLDLLSTSLRGVIAEGLVLADLALKGIDEVWRPAISTSAADLLFVKDDEHFKVQIKYSALKNGIIKLDLRRAIGANKTKRYTLEEVDLFVLYCPDTTKCYYIWANDIQDVKVGLHLRLNSSLNSQTKGVRFASDYEKLVFDKKV